MPEGEDDICLPRMPVSKEDLPPGVLFAVDIPDPKKRIEAYIQDYSMQDEPRSEAKLFDSILMRNNVRVDTVHLGPPVSVQFSVDIRPELCSRTGNLHGGAASLIFDMCTTMAGAPLSTRENWHFGGVSRNLNVSYFRPVPVGTTVHVKCIVESLGKSLATITARMETTHGKLLAVAQHDKAKVDIAARSNKI